jgi:RNA polymerase sigma factor (sigma-70 family)
VPYNPFSCVPTGCVAAPQRSPALGDVGSLDDRSLIREYRQSGDQKYLGEVLERHRPHLLEMSRRMVPASFDEDCVQEAVLRVIRTIHHFDEECTDSCFLAWVTKILHSVCVDELRRETTARRLNSEVVHVCEAHLAPSQHHCLQLHEVAQEIRRLSPDRRVCFVLSRLEGRSYREIMQASHFSYAEVKTHIQTAQRQIDRRFSSGGARP